MFARIMTYNKYVKRWFSLILILFIIHPSLTKPKVLKKSLSEVISDIQNIMSVTVIAVGGNSNDELTIKSTQKKQSYEKIYYSLLAALHKDNKYEVTLSESKKTLLIKKRFGCVIRSSAESIFNDTKHLLISKGNE
ncbi:MAG TPA: hypothetical protein PKC21_05665 [Oligoflexia bacterium]|nr:hypothetical protein [Oligoflexia bacterium]HMR24822.1 hypothetical protein [Oligoflexia bacterium]